MFSNRFLVGVFVMELCVRRLALGSREWHSMSSIATSLDKDACLSRIFGYPLSL